VRRTQWAAAVLVLAAAGCSATPSSPGSSPADLAPTSPQGDLTSDGPPAKTLQPSLSPTPTALASGLASALATGSGSGPSDDPWKGPAGAWPGRILFTYPTTDEVSEIVGVAHDGTIYTHGAAYSPESHEVIRAFNPDGSPLPAWPAGGVQVPGLIEDAVIGEDGGVYIAMHPAAKAGSSGAEPSATTITALDATGQPRRGWPYLTPITTYQPERRFRFGHNLVVRPAGGICFVQKPEKAALTTAPTDLVCLRTDGRPVTGWPYPLPHILGTPAFGPDGTVYVIEYPANTGPTAAAQIVALGLGGQPPDGWGPVTVPAALDSQVVVSPNGTVYALLQSAVAAPVLIAVDANGSPDLGFDTNVAAILGPLGPEAFGEGLAFGPDGTLYLAIEMTPDSPSQRSQVLAIGPDGRSRAGWPFRPGSLYVWVELGPDGSIWVWMSNANAVTPRLVALGSDGAIQPGWPVLGPPNIHEMAFDAHGKPFFVVRPQGLDYLETIDR
jgi:hypothetical protein